MRQHEDEGGEDEEGEPAWEAANLRAAERNELFISQCGPLVRSPRCGRSDTVSQRRRKHGRYV